MPREQRARDDAPSIADIISKREAALDDAALSNSFPPPMPSLSLQERIIHNFCSDLLPGKVEEAGCCVCGQLKLKADMMQINRAGVDLGLLVHPGMTRKERFSLEDPVAKYAALY
ncbi:hypothetical protein BKA70DRAFT_1128931 [Coprinopsis sp. MPI-PUGE-AT-0042]|nr:hypothetical protein BKA70DRAFT_1128931 [Coprinopsis sp. MPI-PUGE-AT-0042]